MEVKRLTLKTIVITVLIGVAVVLGTSGFYSDMASTYETHTPSLANTTDDFTAFSNATDDLTVIIKETQDEITDPGEGSPAISDIYDVTVLFIGFGRILMKIPDVLFALMTGTISMLGTGVGIAIPQWFITMLTVIITVVFVFAVVSFLFKRGEV